MSLFGTAVLVNTDGTLKPIPILVGEKVKIKGIPCVLSYINRGRRRLTFTVIKEKDNV